MAKDRTQAGIRFGCLLRVKRLTLGLDQRALAKLIGLTHPQVSRYEGGYLLPSFSTLVKIHKRLGLTFKDMEDCLNGNPRSLQPTETQVGAGSEE